MPVRCSAPWTMASRRSVVCGGQITMSPSSRGTPSASGSFPSIGKLRTSVGPRLPRGSALSSAIRPAPTNAIATGPSCTPPPASAIATSRSISAGSGASGAGTSPTTSTSSTPALGRTQLRGLTSGVLVVGLDDALHQAVANDVLAPEPDELDALDPLEDLRDGDEPGLLVLREVDLRDVTGDDHLRVEPEPGHDHLHLLGRGVLRLVEDDEGVVQSSSTHERQRRDLDLPALQRLGDALGVEHVVQGVEERAQVRIDLRHEVAGQEAQALAGLDGRAGQDDPVDLAAAQRRGGQRDREERLARSRRPDAEGDRLAPDGVDVALLVDRLRRDLARAMAPHDVVEDLRR